ncbi:hypothetical protein KKE26_08080, partial [bacterium]|nr:hypothetical protein [bacterium]MBU1754520.1 hypothetical protein [bacterium]
DNGQKGDTTDIYTLCGSFPARGATSFSLAIVKVETQNFASLQHGNLRGLQNPQVIEQLHKD